MKSFNFKSIYAGILESCSWSDIVNGYFGSSNLFAEYLNDYSEKGINSEIAEFIDDNKQHVDKELIEDILENPDVIINNAAYEFYQALTCVFDGNGAHVEWVLRNACTWFDAWGKYYVFGNPWSNACANVYIIRSDSMQSAYDELVTRFESAFSIDEDDATEETERNDNCTPINTDYLQCIAEITFSKP